MTRLIATFFLMILVATSMRAATLTLEEALHRALEANPSITRAQADVDAATARRTLARSAILPRIDLDATATQNGDEIGFDVNGSRFSLQQRQDWSSKLVLRQPLYAGGRELKAIKQTALAIEAATASSHSTAEAILFRTATDYLAVVEAEALIAVEKQNVDVAASRRKHAAAMLKAGEVTKVEVLRAEAAQKAAERQLAAAEQRRKEAESQLRLDLALEEDLTLATPEIALPQLPDEGELSARAMAAHPDLRNAAASLQIAKLETRKQRGAYLPTVTLQANFTKQKLNFPSNSLRAVSLSFHLPVFDSGETASRVAMARQEEVQIAAAVAEAQQGVREDIGRSIAALGTARKSFALANEQLTAAQGQYDQIANLYRSQEATSLDIEAAESALAEAKRAVAIGSLQTKLAELRVWFAAGSLKSIFFQENH